MNVLLVSQCSGRAINETRRILDQFAERRGEKVWQTSITQAGLDTLRKLLKASARKNTAVACHWIRGRDHSELIWIVGRANRFNPEGAVPTNITASDVLRSNDEDQWHYGELIRLLAGMAALFHDFGKANVLFQQKLRPQKGRQLQWEPYRHEWVSLRLFQAVIAGCDSDEAWLTRLAGMDEHSAGDWAAQIAGLRDGLDKSDHGAFWEKLPPLARIVAWLVVSHHFLPVEKGHWSSWRWKAKDLCHLPMGITAEWNSRCDESDRKRLEQNWNFKNKVLPTTSQAWRKRAATLARRLSRSAFDDDGVLANPFVAHLARLSLMWGDHHYSSLDTNPRLGDPDFPLYANTFSDRNHPRFGELKQRLDEHLIGVEMYSGRISRVLPLLSRHLPRIARHKAFSKPTKHSRFRWQDKAFHLARGIQAETQRQGFFGVNMASTGCGKTLANARIMYGLANPNHGARFSVALGLRTLMLQTGDAYRDKLGLQSDDLAVLVGGSAVRQLHQMRTDEGSVGGSESQRPLLDDGSYVYYDGAVADGAFNEWLGRDPRMHKLVNAPVLACTIDHLIPATEGARGGRQIAPMMRLLSSDLILDEPDDFDLADLPALTRLVHWAGLLGSRVLLSSATLPPAIVEGLFTAYRAGRESYQQACGQPGLPVNVHCAWFDEFDRRHNQCAEVERFADAHRGFVEQRLGRLADKQAPKVSATIEPLSIAENDDLQAQYAAFAAQVLDLAARLHQDNAIEDQRTGKRVSFGVLRMANINPLYQVARALFHLGGGDKLRLHLCCYHSQHPLLVRSAIERSLDGCLSRHEPQAVFARADIAAALADGDETDHIFLVAATPVCEVGRDHDYDWAIVEPSSMRSIIQLAGRVRRHRPEKYTTTNIALLSANFRHLQQGAAKPAFFKPGFESDGMLLNSHDLRDVLKLEQYTPLNASPRIVERDSPMPRDNLVDLEHDRLRAQMDGGGESRDIPNPLWWQTQVSLTAWFQGRKPFRKSDVSDVYALLPDDFDERLRFCREDKDGLWLEQPGLWVHDELDQVQASSWAMPDYQAELEALAQRLDMDVLRCAQRFGRLELRRRQAESRGWVYHPLLGFSSG